ncbi:MAG: FAD-dependent oxidoreductase [Trueperaceae bacterium]|nr:FAD-dependent oxidoreductase [Trueperaceae bacterium]MCO5173529.1 FAD-dependent oxidoreductase [Trueperaceae bacterium]MCW5818517.1 FAD-dependent oxidoreductase [Trueperaceae bacterium]
MSRHVLVIGAGVIGLMSAYHLRRRGFAVTVLEREGADRGSGEHAPASYGNAGMIVPSHFVPLAAPGVVAQGLRWMADPKSPFYVRPRLSSDLLTWGWRFWRAGTAAHVRASAPLLLTLNLASRDEYVALDDELGGGIGFERLGLTMLCATQHALEEEAKVAEMARALGGGAEVLDAAAVRALEPGIELNVVGGVHFPDDAHLNPGALMRALQARLQADGVEFRFGARVVGFELGDRGVRGVTVRPSGGVDETVTGDEVVLAAGAWTGRIARLAGLSLPMQPGKGYTMTLESPSQRLSVPSILTEARVAVTRMGERLRIGGTMELGGFDEGANDLRVRGIVEAARRYFPRLTEVELAEPPRWHGFRPLSPDGLPYLGRSRRVPNLTVASGHGMMGLSLAPITGKLVGEVVAGEEPSLPIGAMSVERF